MFRSYGAASAVVLLGFLVLNYILPIPAVSTGQEVVDTQDGLDPTAVASYGQSTEFVPPAAATLGRLSNFAHISLSFFSFKCSWKISRQNKVFLIGSGFALLKLYIRTLLRSYLNTIA